MSDIAEERMQNCIDELEQENRLLRARNDRLQKEISELQQNGCKFPMCQSEEYQQGLAEQIKRELYTGEPAQRTWAGLTDEDFNSDMFSITSLGVCDIATIKSIAKDVEAKLRKKNT